MRLASLLVAASVAAAPAAASAGGYVSAGVGPSPSLGGELTSLSSDDARSGRVALGAGFGPLAVEGGLGGFGVNGVLPSGDYVDGTILSASLSLKGSAPILVPGFALYARGGLGRNWVTGDASMDTAAGESYLVGAGAEYAIPMVLADVAFWAELDRDWMTISQDAGTTRGTADVVMIGMRVGI